jgi:hypothetical protein
VVEVGVVATVGMEASDVVVEGAVVVAVAVVVVVGEGAGWTT